MCGRFTLITEVNQLKSYYDTNEVGGYSSPNFNVAPSQFAPIMTPDGLVQARWGLVPIWAKSPSVGYSMINAVGETVLEKPTYKPLMSNGRCLVPASGFYEWVSDGKDKRPVYFKLKSSDLFSFAGLFNQRTSADGHTTYTFTIITTEANSLVAPVHNRMPVILSREQEGDWLNYSVDAASAALMLDSYPDEAMVSYAVSKDVNSARNNQPQLIEPLPS